MIEYHIAYICLTAGAGGPGVGNGDSLPDNTASWEEHRHKTISLSLNSRSTSLYGILCRVFLNRIWQIDRLRAILRLLAIISTTSLPDH
jgi:hypothetical protein